MAYIEFDNVVKSYGSGGRGGPRAGRRELLGGARRARRGARGVGRGQNDGPQHPWWHGHGTSGRVTVDGRDVTAESESELVEYRRADVGFVFQFYNLVPNLTALENVELAAQICPDSLDARETLEKVGLGARLSNFPAQLSGGEQQRVSIARAVAKNPKLLLCDEPTGALDYVTGKQILQLLQDTCRHEGITVVLITHNAALAPMADRLIHFKSGRVTEMSTNPSPTPISQIEW